ncbi:MAG: PQQ-binding-like beta-propeller repeat protein [Bdellovibrionales bacterium]
MRVSLHHVKLVSWSCLLPLILGACSLLGEEVSPLPANNGAPVLESATSDKAHPAMANFDIALPPQNVNPRWTQAGGDTSHAPGNMALSLAPIRFWSTDIGYGSSSDTKLLAAPIIVDGIVYTQDAHGYVSAFALSDGDRLWRTDLTPEEADNESMGGGLAWANGNLFASTGYGQLVALRDMDGSILWRQDVGSPLRAAPTVSSGRVFVISLENEMHVLDATTGHKIWHHRGIAEDASLLGASSPAVKDDIVVVPYSSGELFGLRTQNGRLSWSEVLSVSRDVGGLPAISAIRALPVIADKHIYAISHSGRMTAIDQRSGTRIWEQDIAGDNTPAVVGNAVYVVTNDNKLTALSRQHGKNLWSIPLEIYDKDDIEKDNILSWAGPTMAGGRLWVVSSNGILAAFDPTDGGILYYQKVGDSFYLPPIIADKVMLLLDDSGKLIALH